MRNGVENTPSVNLYPVGGDRWEHHATWPVPGVSTRRCTSTERARWHSHRPPGRRRRAPLLPASSPCSRMTTQWTAGAAAGPCETDNRTYEATVLTYTTEPLTRDTQLTGPIVANVWAELTSKDATLVGVAQRRRPDGALQPGHGRVPAGRASARSTRRRSTFGPGGVMIRPFHPFTRTSQQPVTPNDPALYRIEIYPTDAIFKKGHRMRLTIGTANTPRPRRRSRRWPTRSAARSACCAAALRLERAAAGRALVLA